MTWPFDALTSYLKDFEHVTIVTPPGNVGDKFIQRGTRQLLDEHHIAVRFIDFTATELPVNTSVLCWGGGGNVSGRYNTAPMIQRFSALAKRRDIPFVLLPQSIEKRSPVLDLFDKVFLRDIVSVAMCRNSCLVPDLALANVLAQAKPVEQKQAVFRNDAETTNKHVKNDPRRGMSLDNFISLAGQAEVLETDLLHLSICAALQGVTVYLHPCNWHKNVSMFRTWLHQLPNFNFVS